MNLIGQNFIHYLYTILYNIVRYRTGRTPRRITNDGSFRDCDISSEQIIFRRTRERYKVSVSDNVIENVSHGLKIIYTVDNS